MSLPLKDFPSLKNDIKHRMESALEVLKKEFAGLRTGRASISFLDPIIVDAYGTKTPLNQVASVNIPESRLITINVWDRSLVGSVDKAIREAGLGLNPATEGQLIRIPVPALSEERRAELAKVASKYSEQARISVRNVRRDGMEFLKKMEKDKLISEDEHERYEEDLQKTTDDIIKNIDHLLETKIKEIMQV